MAFLNCGLLSIVSNVNQIAHWVSLCEYLSFMIYY